LTKCSIILFLFIIIIIIINSSRRYNNNNNKGKKKRILFQAPCRKVFFFLFAKSNLFYTHKFVDQYNPFLIHKTLYKHIRMFVKSCFFFFFNKKKIKINLDWIHNRKKEEEKKETLFSFFFPVFPSLFIFMNPPSSYTWC